MRDTKAGTGWLVPRMERLIFHCISFPNFGFFFLTCICYLFKKKKTKLKNNQPLPNIKKPGRQPKNVKILRLHMTVKLGQRKKQKDENFQFGWGDVSHSPLH